MASNGSMAGSIHAPYHIKQSLCDAIRLKNGGVRANPAPMRFGPPLALLAMLLAGCATTASTDLARAEADPWEKSNRRVYAFNKGLDRWVVKPVTQGYRFVTPKPVRTGVSNAFSNYGEPSNFLNAVLQGRFDQAFRTLDRFLLNSTLGVAGVMDVATDLGRPQEPEDFGLTLARWGVKAGPYVVLPLFGPSTLRDGIMSPVDFFVYPSDFVRNAWLSPGWDVRIAMAAGRFVSLRNTLIETGTDGLLASSLDEYALVRSAYLQRRRLQLFDGQLPVEDDPFAEPAEGPAAEPAKPDPPRP
jgi:phospholipid-binding lipoprotein MlaA